MPEPVVTVVIACFNYGEYLDEAVTSVISQDGPPARIVVVDDGSTEETTLQALDRLPPGVELVRQENRGLAAARNAGFALASTPYLLPLDADDRLAAGALRVLVAALDSQPDVGFSYGWPQFFGDWDAVLETPPYDPYKLLYRHMIGATCLMRRELFDDVGGYDPEFRGYEDWEFWLHALARGWRGTNIRAVTLEYRRHGQTMLSDARRDYRLWFKRLRRKHADLYSRSGEFARESDLGVFGRGAYRWFWGARPIPARLEMAMHRRFFGG